MNMQAAERIEKEKGEARSRYGFFLPSCSSNSRSGVQMVGYCLQIQVWWLNNNNTSLNGSSRVIYV